MASIKQTSNALGNLINTINSANNIPAQPPAGGFSGSFGGYQNNQTNIGVQSSTSSICIDDESIPTNMLEAAPVFEMNFKSEKKQCIKKAKKQLEQIVHEVVPKQYQNAKMILDKIEQDAEQLGNLYYSYEKDERMIQAAMETVGHGETQARMFDTYAKLSEKQEKTTVKITEMQNQMRKYYIDAYLDMQQKDETDGYMALPSSEANIEALPDNNESVQVLQAKGTAYVGTDQTIKMIQEKKKLAMKADFNQLPTD